MRWIKTERNEILNLSLVVKIVVHKRDTKWVVAAETKSMYCIIKGILEEISEQQAIDYLNKLYEGIV